VLFSRADVAASLTQHFEAAWQTVRPVPIVRFDFGDGRVITRTLHGNIASYVCAANGQVVDILPGIYTPAMYLAALEQPRLLAASLSRSEPERQTRLRHYHREKAQELRIQTARNAARSALVAAVPVAQGNQPADRGKGVIEFPVERAVGAGLPVGLGLSAVAGPRPRAGSDLAAWEALAVDTRRNETERRLLIHDRLADGGAIRPEQIKGWLYKQVLHVDLDDPYLGLGDALLGDDILGAAERPS
jgi:hypothetical protein